MRTKIALALAGMLAALTLAPASPASANCDHQIVVIDDSGGSGCTNGCTDTIDTLDGVRASVAPGAPSLWNFFACTQ